MKREQLSYTNKMLIISSLLLFLILTCRFLVFYIKEIRTGDPNETNLTYWMFSYDFKPQNKEWVPEEKNLLESSTNNSTGIFPILMS